MMCAGNAGKDACQVRPQHLRAYNWNSLWFYEHVASKDVVLK